MTEFKPSRRLDEFVARLVGRRIQKAIDEAGAKELKKAAPRLKVWITMRDPKVRPEHWEMHGVGIPENLRFVVRTPPYDRQHYNVGAFQFMTGPRDPEASPGLVINCRCELAFVDAIAPTVKAHRVKVDGTKVKGRLTIRGPRLRESEFGNDKDPGLRFMGRALKAIKRFLTGRR